MPTKPGTPLSAAQLRQRADLRARRPAVIASRGGLLYVPPTPEQRERERLKWWERNRPPGY